MSVEKRLRRWLRRTASSVSRLPERDDLPDLPTPEWIRAVAGGADRSVRSQDLAAALLAVAREGDPDLRSAALDALALAEPRWWMAVEQALRERWWSAPHLSRAVAANLADGSADVLQLVVAGCHRDGRIREAAVITSADHLHPAVSAVLALRTVDWVAEVRLRARHAIQGRLRLSPELLAHVAQFAFALRRRREGTWLAGRVEEILRDLPVGKWSPLLTAPDRWTRRAAYRVATAGHLLTLDELITAAIKDDDLPIRTLCARAAVTAATEPAALQRLLASRTALVRAEALWAVTASGDQAAAEAALPDPHPAVRAIAQAALRRGGVDPAGVYRTLAERETLSPGVIAGLGETGGAQDADLVRRWLADPRPRARVEAVRALRRLGAAQVAEMMPLLRDESGAVTRQVVVTLRRDAGSLDPEQLNALLGADNAPHIRFAGYRLLTGGDAWQRLIINLRLIDDADARLRTQSRADIATWLDREAATTYSMPSSDRRRDLDTLIEDGRAILGSHKVRLLRFHSGLPTSAAES